MARTVALRRVTVAVSTALLVVGFIESAAFAVVDYRVLLYAMAAVTVLAACYLAFRPESATAVAASAPSSRPDLRAYSEPRPITARGEPCR